MTFEVDVLDRNYVLSTTIKSLLTRRINRYASLLGISREVGIAVNQYGPTSRSPDGTAFFLVPLHSVLWHEHCIRHGIIRVTVVLHQA